MKSAIKIFALALAFIVQQAKFESCHTEDVAACFANATDGGRIDLVSGTMSSWDGKNELTQFYMQDKHVIIACNEGGETCILKGAKGKRVVMITNIPGRTTLARLIIRDGDTSSIGGGLLVSNSNVNLIMSSFVDNSADRGGAIYVGSDDSNTVTLQGCIFEGNTATTNGPDIYNGKIYWFDI